MRASASCAADICTGAGRLVGRVAGWRQGAGGNRSTRCALLQDLEGRQRLALQHFQEGAATGADVVDIGPKTAAILAAQLKAAGTIVWNGPVGVFEFEAFAQGTEVIARAIADSPAFSIAGGGDTLAAIAKYGIEADVGYISTGGGAFLEVLEGKTLPAFEILEKRAAG